RAGLGAAGPALGVAAALGIAALVGWHGATAAEPVRGTDAQAHVAYAEILATDGRLPTEEESYEYASPPASHWAALQAQRLADAAAGAVREVAEGPGSPAGRVVWLAGLLGAALLLALPGGGRGRRAAGLALAASVAVLAVLDVAATAAETRWTVGQAVSLLAVLGLLGVAWALARTLWPERRFLPLVALGATAALPIVLRLGTMFHPEALFAFLAGCALLIVVRAQAARWPLGHALALGGVLGLSALTRQTAAILIVSLGLAVLLAGRRDALRFVAVTAAALLLVAGPWWLHQLDRYGNPIQSNLEREGYMLEDGQPLSFYVSFPARDLVLHPYRPAFENELLPKFHADLWSDWFATRHGSWADPSPAARLFASTQSVLGLFASAFALVALVALGARPLAAAVRGRELDLRSFAFATFLLLAALTWIAFVVTLVRFPQADGDPIKASYMLFLAPVFAVAAAGLAHELWHARRTARLALAGWAGLYAVSYAGFLATAF
ncbi:MAG TPA: hypothetical protein VML35_00840, partial [Gaiellaceae bacterium]|nr:hypothetical protein [Gaiellaceae bacterium]